MVGLLARIASLQMTMMKNSQDDYSKTPRHNVGVFRRFVSMARSSIMVIVGVILFPLSLALFGMMLWGVDIAISIIGFIFICALFPCAGAAIIYTIFSRLKILQRIIYPVCIWSAIIGTLVIMGHMLIRFHNRGGILSGIISIEIFNREWMAAPAD